MREREGETERGREERRERKRENRRESKNLRQDEREKYILFPDNRVAVSS